MRARTWLAALLSATLALPSLGNDVDDSRVTSAAASSAFADGDTEPAYSYEEVREAAEEGDTDAQFLLGLMYLNGRGIEQDYNKAAYWFRTSYADPWSLSRIEGQVAMAVMHHIGLGTPRDYVEACYLFETAANIGDPFDIYNLDNELFDALGVRPDFAASVEWFQEAAANNGADAQFCLAVAYYRGLVLDQDLSEAINWLDKSANNGNAWAQYYLGFMYLEGDGVEENAAEAAKWYEKAALQEFAGAQCMLAIQLYYGQGVAQSEEKAKYWFRKAIENGDTTAMEMWGWLGFGEFDDEQYAGSFKGSTYVAPGELFTAGYRLQGGSPQDPCCEETVQDWLDPESGIGVVVLSNGYGALNGVIYGPAALAERDDYALLRRWFDEIVMGLILSNAEDASVLHEEARRFHDMDAWIAAVEVPGGGVMARLDLQTGTSQRSDSVRGFVVFEKGDNVFALMCEMNVMSFTGKAREYEPDNWDVFLDELSAFYSTMTFRGHRG